MTLGLTERERRLLKHAMWVGGWTIPAYPARAAALADRGLVEARPDGKIRIAPAGRQALVDDGGAPRHDGL